MVRGATKQEHQGAESPRLCPTMQLVCAGFGSLEGKEGALQNLKDILRCRSKQVPRVQGRGFRPARRPTSLCQDLLSSSRCPRNSSLRSPPSSQTGEQTKLHVFGRWHNIPRKQTTYGDPGLTYTYSGVTFSPKPWLPVLDRIRDRVRLATGHPFNFVLVNR